MTSFMLKHATQAEHRVEALEQEETLGPVRTASSVVTYSNPNIAR